MKDPTWHNQVLQEPEIIQSQNAGNGESLYNCVSHWLVCSWGTELILGILFCLSVFFQSFSFIARSVIQAVELGLHPFLQTKEPFKDMVSMEVRGKRLLRKWFCFCFTVSLRLNSMLSDVARSGPCPSFAMVSDHSLCCSSCSSYCSLSPTPWTHPLYSAPGPCSCSFLYLKHLFRRSFPSSVLAVIQIWAQASLLNNALPVYPLFVPYSITIPILVRKMFKTIFKVTGAKKIAFNKSPTHLAWVILLPSIPDKVNYLLIKSEQIRLENISQN